MTAPAVAAARFAGAVWVGAGLGAAYGFLRPLRRKRNWPADLLFLGAVFYGWLYVGFGICGGDLRLAWVFAMALGGIGWEMTLGRLLRPLYFRIFDIFGKFLQFCSLPGKKFWKFLKKIAKKVFAKWKKWVTIGGNIHWHGQQKNGGEHHRKTKKKTVSAGVAPHQTSGQGHDFGSGDSVHHRAGGAAGRH